MAVLQRLLPPVMPDETALGWLVVVRGVCGDRGERGFFLGADDDAAPE